MERFAANIFVDKLEQGDRRGPGYYWSVSNNYGHTAEAGVESTRLKAWRKACAVARRDFGPIKSSTTRNN